MELETTNVDFTKSKDADSAEADVKTKFRAAAGALFDATDMDVAEKVQKFGELLRALEVALKGVTNADSLLIDILGGDTAGEFAEAISPGSVSGAPGSIVSLLESNSRAQRRAGWVPATNARDFRERFVR